MFHDDRIKVARGDVVLITAVLLPGAIEDEIGDQPRCREGREPQEDKPLARAIQQRAARPGKHQHAGLHHHHRGRAELPIPLPGQQPRAECRQRRGEDGNGNECGNRQPDERRASLNEDKSARAGQHHPDEADKPGADRMKPIDHRPQRKQQRQLNGHHQRHYMSELPGIEAECFLCVQDQEYIERPKCPLEAGGCDKILPVKTAAERFARPAAHRQQRPTFARRGRRVLAFLDDQGQRHEREKIEKRAPQIHGCRVRDRVAQQPVVEDETARRAHHAKQADERAHRLLRDDVGEEVVIGALREQIEKLVEHEQDGHQPDGQLRRAGQRMHVRQQPSRRPRDRPARSGVYGLQVTGDIGAEADQN